MIVTAAAAVLLILSVWCVFSRHYDDGLVGRAAFGVLAVASYAAMTANTQHANVTAWAVALIALAVAAMRHMWVVRKHQRCRGF